MVGGNDGISNQNVNQTGYGNVVAAWAEVNGNRNNGDIDEIKKVIANCSLMANLQQALTSGTQTYKAPVYDSDRSAEVLNYAKENAYLKTIYKNLFDSINVIRAQTKIITDSLQDKLNDTIYENTKLRDQLFDKVSEQKGTTKGTSANTKFANQSTSGTKLYFVTPLPKTKVLPKVVEMNDLSNPVTSNLAPTLNDSQVLKNDKVIAPGMFRINLVKTFREYKFVPINQARANVRTNPITVSQPHVITMKNLILTQVVYLL
ncbi:hypothetical protein Tco_0120959 [Tanacetum coccineum]